MEEKHLKEKKILEEDAEDAEEKEGENLNLNLNLEKEKEKEKNGDLIKKNT